MNRIFLLVSALLLASVSACNLPLENPPGGAASPSMGQSTPTNTISNTPEPPPEHRIGVRVVDGTGEFYDRVTKEKFVPRGMNYIRLGPVAKADGQTLIGHNLFDPGQYNSLRASSALNRMHMDGYNVVRVFLSPDTMGTDAGGLSPEYMKNLVDFLKYARQNQIYVIFTTDWLPGGKYGEILNRDCCSTFALMNANFLPPAGLEANRVFFQDFARELIALGAPIEYVFSYEIRNEMFFDGDQPPLSMSSGTVVTANGKSYDMSNSSDKKRMVEESVVYWIDEVRAAVLEVDPTALVGVGFFQPQAPNRTRVGDPRIAVTEPVIWQSKADFVDLHPYDGFELNLQQYVENYGINGMQEKPIIMGEFGGQVQHFGSIETASQRFVKWQTDSCKYGFDGWIFWTWDLSEQPDFFHALMGDGQIERALAPVNRPDPCAP